MVSVDKCECCRDRKLRCSPQLRLWIEGGTQEKCDNCKKSQRKCGPNERVTYPKRQQARAASAMSQSPGSGEGSINTGDGSALGEFQDANIQLRQRLKDSLKELDAEVAYTNQLQHIEMALAARQALLRPEDPYKGDTVQIMLTAMKTSTPRDQLAKLAQVELLADQAAEAGLSDAAEIAYVRALKVYRSLGCFVSSPFRQLLMKVALFYFKIGEPLQGEESLWEVCGLRDNPHSVHMNVWQQLMTSLPTSSEELSRILRSKELGHEIAPDTIEPFPPLHRILRSGYASKAPPVVFHHSGNLDITGSPALHSAIVEEQDSRFAMIEHCSDIDLEGRDVNGRTPMFMCALFRDELAGRSLLSRFDRYPPEVRERALEAMDYLGQTILAVAILSGCTYDFIKMLIDNGARVDPESLMGNVFTPLQAAAILGRSEIVALLLQYGADPKRVYLDEEATALQLARKAGHYNIVEILSVASTVT